MTKAQLENYHARFRSLANSGRYGEGYRLAKQLRRKHPEELLFIYVEAVLYGDDEDNRSQSEIFSRHRKAAKMLRPLLRKLRGMSDERRASIRNEYYWFSHQPYKQYLLGIEGVRAGNRRSYYSQGVGAVELACRYARQRQRKRTLSWAKRAERAWLNFFKLDAKWYNSYGWYGKSLGLQGRFDEMEKALAKAAKISGKSKNCFEFRVIRKEVMSCLSDLGHR